MRVLITGANGFVGRHLVRELREHGHEVVALVYGTGGADAHVAGALESLEGDISDSEWLMDVVASRKTDACIHLAGMSFVPDGASNPDLVFTVNLMGTLSMLEAFRRSAPRAKILAISSSHVYGEQGTGKPVKESDALAPANHYAASKAAADLLTLVYAKEHGMRTMTARPHNHIGPGQSERFVVSSFAAQLRKISQAGGKGVIRVGNLESARDFTDVRDVVRAYRLLIEKGRDGEAYNIASGRSAKVSEVLEELIKLAKVHPEITVDKKLFRPTAPCPMLDTSKIEKDTGWRPSIPLQQTLRDIYETQKD